LDRIGFGAGVHWGAVSQTEYQRLAKDHRHPLAYRVHFAALGWANRIGHAEFVAGDLASLLAVREGVPLGASSVSRAIAKARSLDLVGRDSGVRCLTLPPHHFQKAARGTNSCRTHGIRTVG
jgi:hypothetical protein